MNYKRTKLACYSAYVTMASAFALPPLLFVTFHDMYGVSYTLLGTLVLTNFCTQLTVDLILSFFSKYFNEKFLDSSKEIMRQYETQIEEMEKMLLFNVRGIVFDSNTNNWSTGNSDFDSIVNGREKVAIVIIDTQNNIFGAYITASGNQHLKIKYQIFAIFISIFTLLLHFLNY